MLINGILQNKNQKCLSCEGGGRGQSMSTKGQALHGDGPEFLNKCRCPIDTVATEFWMYKATANDPQVPLRNDPNIPASDFALNPVSLRLIGAAIRAAAGLETEDLFTLRRTRLETTARWALNEMVEECVEDEQKVKVRRMVDRFEQVMDDVHQLDLSEEEDV